MPGRLTRWQSSADTGKPAPRTGVSAAIPVVPSRDRRETGGEAQDPPPPEDPTQKAVSGLLTAASREIAEADRADRRAAAMESARQANAAESGRWKRRELLVRQQIAGLSAEPIGSKARPSRSTPSATCLARERDALKAALVKARAPIRDSRCCLTRAPQEPGGGRSCWSALPAASNCNRKAPRSRRWISRRSSILGPAPWSAPSRASYCMFEQPIRPTGLRPCPTWCSWFAQRHTSVLRSTDMPRAAGNCFRI